MDINDDNSNHSTQSTQSSTQSSQSIVSQLNEPSWDTIWDFVQVFDSSVQGQIELNIFIKGNEYRTTFLHAQ